jgi:site-specific DNA-methyltransferase (adenine-specific)
MQTNEIYNKNFLENDLPAGCAKLIIADPPYYKVKGAFDFIWPSFDAYLKDVDLWAAECRRLLADNGSLFWWGHARKIAYSQIILDKYLNLENVCKWEKSDCQTRKGAENYRSFCPVTEHVLFYSLDSLNLTECIFFIRDYIREEIEKAKGQISFKEINTILGTATNGGGVASACFSLSKSEPAMVTEEHYKKLQSWCNPYLKKPYEFLRKEYEELRKEYEELRKEYEDKRRHFDNKHKLTDVFKYSQQVNETAKYDHETKKPEHLTRALIETTTKPGDLVIVPFSGSGTECAMAARTRRPFIGYDIELKHVLTGQRRVKKELKAPEFNFGL